MDYADDDAVTRFEYWEKALEMLAEHWASGVTSDPAMDAFKLLGDASLIRMKREAIINAARVEGTAHLSRVQKAFPGVDVPALVQALRVKVAEMRLLGE